MRDGGSTSSHRPLAHTWKTTNDETAIRRRLGLCRNSAGELPPAFAGWAQQPEAPLKAGRPIKAGDVLSGELNALRVRDAKMGKRVATYEITTEPRRLPPPNGLCNLETGPETFQLVAASDAQAGQLKSLVAARRSR